jgi:hypothetical protein
LVTAVVCFAFAAAAPKPGVATVAPACSALIAKPKLMARARKVVLFMQNSPFPPSFLDSGNLKAENDGTRDFACHDCNRNVSNVSLNPSYDVS